MHVYLLVKMNTGLTIAFICLTKNHDTITNFRKFGNYFWDDTSTNKSKIGYYFIYYFQKNYVFIYKIINILPPSERPVEMDWDSDRNILCLSDRLITFSWEEWTRNVGFGAPYTSDYRNTQTCSWSYEELSNKFVNFDLHLFEIKLKSYMVPEKEPNSEPNSEPEQKLNSVMDESNDETEEERELREEAEAKAKLEQLAHARAKRKAEANIIQLRTAKAETYKAEAERLRKEAEDAEAEAAAILLGQRDESITKDEADKNGVVRIVVGGYAPYPQAEKKQRLRISF
jgi:hypothetical protein